VPLHSSYILIKIFVNVFVSHLVMCVLAIVVRVILVTIQRVLVVLATLARLARLVVLTVTVALGNRIGDGGSLFQLGLGILGGCISQQ
jgi:hypothetical protein